MKKIFLSNTAVLFIFTVIYAFLYLPQTSIGFEPYNKYINIPSTQNSIVYKLPGKTAYTMKYVTRPDLSDDDLTISINGRSVSGISSIVRGEHKTFKRDIPGDYFKEGDNEIRFLKRTSEPEGYSNKFTLRNFKKNILDLNIFLILNPSDGYFSMLAKGLTLNNIARLFVYFMLLIFMSVVIADSVLLKITSITHGTLYKVDYWINVFFAVLSFVFLIANLVLPYMIVMVPLFKYFSIYVFLQSIKFFIITLIFFKGRFGDRLFTLFLCLFATFVMFLLTDMRTFAMFSANIAYVFLAVSVIVIAIQWKREGSLAKKTN